MNRIFFVSAICAIVLFTAGSASQTKRRLSEDEVVRKAEAFIIQPGYTDLPPTQDKTKLKAAFDEGTDDASITLRRNTLLKTAYGVSRRNGTSWFVVFRLNPDNETYLLHAIDVSKRGRAVTMDAYGGNITIQHQDVNLKFRGLKRLNR
jgi:hypothetical protein